MKQTLPTLIATGALLLGLQTANALPITGELNLLGDVILNNANIHDATKIESFSEVYANAASDGVFEPAGSVEAPVTMHGFDFTNFSPVAPLWELSYGGDTFRFDLNSLTSVTKYSNASGYHINIVGTGDLTSNNYDPSTGSFTMTISSTTPSDALFKFGFQATSSTSATSVPDGGTTALLLGIGAIALAGGRKFVR